MNNKEINSSINFDEIVNKLVAELNKLPDGSEISTIQLLRKFDNNGFSTHDLFEIQKLFIKKCNEQYIELDYSKHKDSVVGLPFNISFIKKTKEIKNTEYEFYKNNENDIIWWVNNQDSIGENLFSFDKKIIFNLFRDYPYKLTNEQKEIFDKENPYWADFFKDRK